jgi:hypothetical protein
MELVAQERGLQAASPSKWKWMERLACDLATLKRPEGRAPKIN